MKFFNGKYSGVIMILFAAILWSSNAPFIRYLSLQGIEVVAFRAVLAGLALLPFLRIKKIKISWYLLGYIVCFAGLVFGVVMALKMTSSAIAIGMQYISCLWLFLISKPKGKDFRISRIWPMLVLIIGVVITFFSSGEGVTLEGNLIALSTSFTFAGSTWFAKKINTDNAMGLSCLGNLFAGVIAMIIVSPTWQFVSQIQLTEWMILLYLAIFQTGLAYTLYYIGLKHVSSTTASTIAPTEMILAPIWTAIFLGEIPDLFGFIGFLLVVAGVIGESIVSSRANKLVINKQT